MIRLCLLTAALAAAPSADAATYIATRAAGGATAQLSITTDDTVGVLGTDNIVDWTIRLTSGGETMTLFGPSGGENSRVQIRGNQLSATATSLLFNFDGAANSYLFFQSTVGDRSLYCVQTTNCFDQNAGEEIVSLGPLFTNFGRDRRTGVQTLAAVQAPVPEPAAWALLALGFGGLGYVLRRRSGPATRVHLA